MLEKYNVIEYKSLEDNLSIDDFYKTMGYACLYKGYGNRVDQIPAEELTISIFRKVVRANCCDRTACQRRAQKPESVINESRTGGCE